MRAGTERLLQSKEKEKIIKQEMKNSPAFLMLYFFTPGLKITAARYPNTMAAVYPFYLNRKSPKTYLIPLFFLTQPAIYDIIELSVLLVVNIMFGSYSKDLDFDIDLAMECAKTFSDVSDLGCVVSDTDGNELFHCNYTCENCSLCTCFNVEKMERNQVHSFGMKEAERFGGKYLYNCPIGLSFFCSPIISYNGSVAKITAGPFLMIEPDEFIHYEMKNNSHFIQKSDYENAVTCLMELPYISPAKANSLSSLLFMIVGYINNVSSSERLLTARTSYNMQGQISSFIQNLKESPLPKTYPLELESALLHSISSSDKKTAQKLLNDLLGYIFFSSAGDFGSIKARSLELMILMSRSAISGGADPAGILNFNQYCTEKILQAETVEGLCIDLVELTNGFMNSTFELHDAKHTEMIRKAITYIRQHSTEKLSLADVAEQVFLSPTYFSKIFNQEIGCSFTHYLNTLRIEQSKVLLIEGKLNMAEISAAVGFSDKEYFSRTFKKIVGCSPIKFKKTKGIANQFENNIPEEKSTV